MLVVITYKGTNAVWQVIDQDKNCAVVADDFKTANAAHAWIRSRRITKA